MPATRLPLIFARASAWLAVGMLLFPWADLAPCQCGHGRAHASPHHLASSCCCQSASRGKTCCSTQQAVQTASCCSTTKQDAPAPSCCGSTGPCQCGPNCHCGCSRKENSQPPQTPLPATPNSFEQMTWGLAAPTVTAGCAPLNVFSLADSSQFQQLIPVSALERCIALSRFTC